MSVWQPTTLKSGNTIVTVLNVLCTDYRVTVTTLRMADKRCAVTGNLFISLSEGTNLHGRRFQRETASPMRPDDTRSRLGSRTAHVPSVQISMETVNRITSIPPSTTELPSAVDTAGLVIVLILCGEGHAIVTRQGVVRVSLVV